MVPSAEIMVRDGGHDRNAAAGSEATYLCLGPGFSSACNTPFRRHKTWVHEGGISTPLIVHWPAGIESKNELRHTPGHVIDILPTILDATGVERPDQFDGEKLPPAPGRSLVPVFAKDQPLDREALWWLHEGNMAIRVGDWKLVSAKMDRVERGKPNWELYDLSNDRSETNDLAKQFPDKVSEMAELWNEQLKQIRRMRRKTK